MWCDMMWFILNGNRMELLKNVVCKPSTSLFQPWWVNACKNRIRFVILATHCSHNIWAFRKWSHPDGRSQWSMFDKRRNLYRQAGEGMSGSQFNTSSPSHWQQVEEQAPKPVGWTMCFLLMTLVPIQKLYIYIYIYIYTTGVSFSIGEAAPHHVL